MPTDEQLAVATKWLDELRGDAVMVEPSPEALATLLRRYGAGLLREVSSIAGGWTGEANTLENAAVVTKVCNAIRREILERAAQEERG